MCTKGTPPAAASTAKPETRAQAACNIAACTDAYISFNASDCTYQPSDGPRRICTK
ncbi:MAG: BA14K family protein [Proteobacteria bacterium]|nr:BA14K family protein [Pseudomonadota bacterium]